jgi:hypothetical protein
MTTSRFSASGRSEGILDLAVSCPASNASAVRFARWSVGPTRLSQRSRRSSKSEGGSKRRLPRRPMFRHSKGSVHFEILPCQNRASIGATELGRISFRARVWIQDVGREICWIRMRAVPALSRDARKQRAPPPREGRGRCVPPEARRLQVRAASPPPPNPAPQGGAGRSAQVRKRAACGFAPPRLATLQQLDALTP